MMFMFSVFVFLYVLSFYGNCDDDGFMSIDDGSFPLTLNINPDNGFPVDMDPSEFANRIASGSDVEFADHPYVVQVIQIIPGESFVTVCGGSIIYKDRTKKSKNIYNQGIILTAAHCVDENDETGTFVRIGCSSFLPLIGPDFNCATGQPSDIESTTYTVSKIIIHPDFGSISLQYDIAILVLHLPITTPSNAIQLSLPYNRDDKQRIFCNKYADVVGYGIDELENFPTELQYTKMKIITSTGCDVVYSNTITEDNICYVDPNFIEGPCGGDSGSPVVLHDNTEVIVGIHIGSGGGCTDLRPPGIGTRITSHIEWIEENIGSRKTSEKQYYSSNVELLSFSDDENKNIAWSYLTFISCVVMLTFSIIMFSLKIYYDYKVNKSDNIKV